MLPMLAITTLSGEVDTLRKLEWGAGGLAALVASCLGGLGMSYFSFALRAVISATSFSVIGNVCKVLTILVNLLMWDNHASAFPPAPPALSPNALAPTYDTPAQGHPCAPVSFGSGSAACFALGTPSLCSSAAHGIACAPMPCRSAHCSRCTPVLHGSAAGTSTTPVPPCLSCMSVDTECQAVLSKPLVLRRACTVRTGCKCSP